MTGRNNPTKVGDKLHSETARRGESAADRWRSWTITGETKGCWLLEDGDKPNKITLRTPKDRLGHQTRYYTDAQMQNKKFCDKHARDIASAVSVCDDAEKLRTIALLIGLIGKE